MPSMQTKAGKVVWYRDIHFCRGIFHRPVWCASLQVGIGISYFPNPGRLLPFWLKKG